MMVSAEGTRTLDPMIKSHVLGVPSRMPVSYRFIPVCGRRCPRRALDYRTRGPTEASGKAFRSNRDHTRA